LCHLPSERFRVLLLRTILAEVLRRRRSAHCRPWQLKLFDLISRVNTISTSGEFGLGEERLYSNKQRLLGPTSIRKNYFRGRLLVVLNNNGGLATVAQTPALPGNYQLKINPLTTAIQAPQRFTYRPYLLTTRTDVASFIGGAVGVWAQMGSSVLNPEGNFTPRMMEGLSALNPSEN